MKKLLLSLFIISFIAACTLELAEPNQKDLAWAQKKYPNITLNDLSEGKLLFEKNCGLCHSLRRPLRKNESELPDIIAEMSKKVNKKRNMEVIGDKEEQLLLQYLVTLNGAPN